MDNITIKDLKKIVNGSTVRETDKEKCIDNLFINTKDAQNHGLFIPFKGKNVDAHSFIEDCVSKKRAIYSLSEQNIKKENVIVVESVQESLNSLAKFVRKNSSAKIIGITGSNGKTTTKNMISALLGESHSVCFTQGNLNNFIGLPMSISKLNKEHKYGVFEVGISEPNEMDSLANILNPDISIITSISASHMEFYKDIDEIKKEKAKISYSTKEIVIINGEVEGLKEFCNPEVHTLSFGISEQNDFVFRPVYEGGFLSVEYHGTLIKTNFIGVDNVANIYASITLLIILGYTVQEIQLLFEDLRPAKGRMNLIRKSEFDIIDDAYNANPDSVKNLLKTIGSFGLLKKKIVILGEMAELGKDTKKFHKEIVENFEDNFEYILKGDIYKEIVDENLTNVKIFNNNEEIFEYLKKSDLKNSVIGIKGSNSTKMFEIVSYLDEVFS